MAENGHYLNGNNNKTKTETDATHFRLRNDQHPKTNFVCQSCRQKFEGTSLIQVYEHYAENVHDNYFGLCFYCSGKVHKYFEESTSSLKIYHNCLRSKRGEDK